MILQSSDVENVKNPLCSRLGQEDEVKCITEERKQAQNSSLVLPTSQKTVFDVAYNFCICMILSSMEIIAEIPVSPNVAETNNLNLG